MLQVTWLNWSKLLWKLKFMNPSYCWVYEYPHTELIKEVLWCKTDNTGISHCFYRLNVLCLSIVFGIWFKLVFWHIPRTTSRCRVSDVSTEHTKLRICIFPQVVYSTKAALYPLVHQRYLLSSSCLKQYKWVKVYHDDRKCISTPE